MKSSPAALLVALTIGATACSRASLVRVPGARDAPAVIEHLDPPLVFGPVEHPAAGYDEPATANISDGGLLAGLAAFVPPGVELARDPRLDLAANELAKLEARHVSPSAALVQFALDAQGVVEPGHVYVGRGASAAEQLAQLTPKLADKLAALNTHVGVATAAGLAVVVVAYKPSVTFEHAPREVDGATLLAGMLGPPYHVPHVTITHDDDTLEPVVADLDADGHFHARFACGVHRGTQWVAVTADDRVAPLAVVPISCGEPPPATYRVESDPSLTTADVAYRIAALINRERIAAHVAPLVPDGPSTAAAQAYAAVMARAQDVAHDLDGTTPPSRLEAAGRRPILVSESTLKADDLRQATEVLLDDPMYQRQVVDGQSTHVGVGVVAGRGGELFVAIEYIEILPVFDVAAIEAKAAADMTAPGRTRRTSYYGRKTVREIAGPPVMDHDLSALAREIAGDIARGWHSTAVIETLQRRLVDEHIRYSNIDYRVVLVTEPARVDLHELWPAGTVIDNVGVGAAQSSRAGPDSGRTYLVVLTARYSAPVLEWKK